MTSYRLDLNKLHDPAETDKAESTERAGFVDLAGIAAQAWHWPQVIQSATVYRARCGQRRTFPSAADAMAYEHGYYHPEQMHALNTPAFIGWCDFEFEVALRDEEKLERAQERWDA